MPYSSSDPMKLKIPKNKAEIDKGGCKAFLFSTHAINVRIHSDSFVLAFLQSSHRTLFPCSAFPVTFYFLLLITN